MYSFEEKIHALDILKQLNGNTRATVRLLGYPSRTALINWQKEFVETGSIHSSYKYKTKYSDEEKEYAVEYYMSHGKNITKTVNDLGYPCRSTLSNWIYEKYTKLEKPALKGGSLVKYTYREQVDAVVDFCLRSGSAEEIVKRTGISRTSLYNWKHQLLPEVSSKEVHENLNKVEGKDEILELKAQVEDLRSQIHRLQMERDALEKAAEIVKKAKGINLQMLSNCEKARTIDALRYRYNLAELLSLFKLSKSSYYYQRNAINRPDKYLDVRSKIVDIFKESGETYGYRRVNAVLRRRCISISEKVVRKLMKEEQLLIRTPRVRKYNSYKGELTPAVPNLIQRDFHAKMPNEKWLTDITEFQIPAGKVYLSPIIDCFDGMPVAWTIGTSPNADLVNTMLTEAIGTLPDNAHPIVHSDRGAHYRWPGWIEIMNSANLIRSMSRKGCSPDNAACEAFFGRLKTEMFYGRC